MGGGRYLFTLGWSLACARWVGWPRPEGQRVQRRDLIRFAAIGLLLYPLVLALVGFSIALVSTSGAAVSTVFQMFFAKQFGVAVVTLPVVVAWRERGHPAPRSEVRLYTGCGWSRWGPDWSPACGRPCWCGKPS